MSDDIDGGSKAGVRRFSVQVPRRFWLSFIPTACKSLITTERRYSCIASKRCMTTTMAEAISSPRRILSYSYLGVSLSWRVGGSLLPLCSRLQHSIHSSSDVAWSRRPSPHPMRWENRAQVGHYSITPIRLSTSTKALVVQTGTIVHFGELSWSPISNLPTTRGR
ncbi:hypothetical protein SCHPADRAFT_341085 [Schizopora paradoxa]|uniref:Uncharacterized protein n=1 Tax=Schizopora paradoxa TaxID=27342 RepID=A0A0H2RQK1_9AGAM|nr:hypothetical protein SCHPADRAFT_341085 [Schizopora paradoxa]